MSTKFCINCTHAIQITDTVYRCAASGTPDLVTGAVHHEYCSVMRLKSEPCGIEGKLFKPEVRMVTLSELLNKGA